MSRSENKNTDRSAFPISILPNLFTLCTLQTLCLSARHRSEKPVAVRIHILSHSNAPNASMEHFATFAVMVLQHA